MDPTFVAKMRDSLRTVMGLLTLFVIACYKPVPLDEGAILREIKDIKPSYPEATAGDIPPSAISEETAVATAMEHHPDLVVARAAIPVAKGEAKKAAAWRNPQLRVGNEDAVEQDLREQVTVALRWYLPHPVQHLARVEAAEALIPVAEAASEEVAWNVRRDTRIAYTKAVYAARKAALVSERVSVREKIRDALKMAVERGFREPSDATRAEIRWLQAMADKSAAQTEERRAHIELARLMGIGDPDILKIRDPGPGFTCPKPTMDESALEEQVLPSHPELKKARNAYHQAEAELKFEHSKWIPWFDYFQVGYEYEREQGRSSVHFGFAIDLPILDWNRGGIAVAEAKRERERIRFREALAEALMKIRKGISIWREAADAVERTVSMLLPATSQAVQLLQQGVTMGQKDEIVVLEAMERDIEARITHLDAVLACRISAIEVEHASGVQLLPFM